MPFVLLLGGARSGKSALAVRIAAASEDHVTFIATAQAGDDEMAERIGRHRAERPGGWTTVEEPLALLDAVLSAPADDFLVVDCLTLWVSGLVEWGEGEEAILAAAGEVARALAHRPPGAVVVSNEVGLGIVPTNRTARVFRDTLGSVNTAFAALADRSALMVAGRLHQLGPAADFMEGIRWPARRPSSS
jgi:adenosyl cobinamide kinase/adenosyl cobinamide phosphate guanylyltransferase